MNIYLQLKEERRKSGQITAKIYNLKNEEDYIFSAVAIRSLEKLRKEVSRNIERLSKEYKEQLRSA
jgi:predicted AlkP superfamily phosphohydrolase/phosphomutase